jgi:L-ascorbate metabolism protein UlaG (beta-lactamase superfamily)
MDEAMRATTRQETRDTRRRFLREAGMGGIAAIAAVTLGAKRASAEASRPGSLRLLKVRHSTFLVELADRRVLVDPAFSRGLGFGPLVDAPQPALPAHRVGALDLVCVTQARSDHFDPRGIAELPGRRSHCFVPDEGSARKLRHLGFSRVRVVRPGDRFWVGGVRVDVSPASDGLFGGPAVGYRFGRAGRSLWHTGATAPLDLDDGPARWAREHKSEVVLACWDGAEVADGRRLSSGPLDAQLTAALARARVVIPQHDDAHPTLVGRGLWSREEGVASREIRDGPRVVVVERGVWYRVAAPRRSGV